MSDLVGIQISDLTQAPSVNGSTEFPIQRPGVTKAEKVTLNTMSNFILSSQSFSVYLDTGVSQRIQDHAQMIDPHGDRAYSNLILNSHKTDTDPHGDRAFTTQAVLNHKTATDPHGDRAYADTAASNAVTAHSTAIDPHGDRAYADGKLVEAKQYVDTKVENSVINKLGVDIAPLVNGKVPASYLPKTLEFSSRLAFPAQGSNSVLYIDTAGNDVYRWTGADYRNLTPEVSLDNLVLSTDIVTEGEDLNRRYFNTTLEEKYDAKLDTVETDVVDENQSLIMSSEENKVVLKGIQANSGIQIKQNDESPTLVITDDTYNYEVITEDNSITDLELVGDIKDNVLDSLDTGTCYNISGEVTCFQYKKVNDISYILKSEQFKIETILGLEGTLEDVAAPTNVVINTTGAVITGNGPANKQIKAHNSDMTEVGIGYVLENGTFSINLTIPITNGSPIYLYTVDGNGRSDTVRVDSPRLNLINDASVISVDNTGLIIKGQSEKNASIVILKSIIDQETEVASTVSIGTGTCDNKGLFSITLTEAVDEDTNLIIKATSGTVTEETPYEVILHDFIPLQEVFVSMDRTNIKGKVEPQTLITILDEDEIEIGLIDSGATGIFDEQIDIDHTISKIYFTISRSSTVTDPETEEETEITKEFNYTLNLTPYYNTTDIPAGVLKISSSSFNKIHEVITRKKNNTNFTLNSVLTNESIKLRVNNTEGVETKWIGKFKIKTIDL